MGCISGGGCGGGALLDWNVDGGGSGGETNRSGWLGMCVGGEVEGLVRMMVNSC